MDLAEGGQERNLKTDEINQIFRNLQSLVNRYGGDAFRFANWVSGRIHSPLLTPVNFSEISRTQIIASEITSWK
jgi:hypothetical protein